MRAVAMICNIAKMLTVAALVPLLAAALAHGADADWIAKAYGASSYSATKYIVCGDRLCTEYPGGRQGFESAMAAGEQEGREAIPPDGGGATDAEDGADTAAGDSMEMAAGDSMEMAAGDSMEMDDGADMAAGDHAGTGDGADTAAAAVADGAVLEKSEAAPEEPAAAFLKLSRASVPADIPLRMGYHDGGDVYYIITDSSDPAHASIISEAQGWNVEVAPPLASAPEEALSTTYMFTNGVEGTGVHGFQGEVFTSTPAQKESYSALTGHIHVAWNAGTEPVVLTSEEDVLAAEEDGMLTLTPLDVVINMPHVKWPGGQMAVKEDAALTDETPYGGGQVLGIDTEEMIATFVAHRGWGPDGRTIYYIVTDATPDGPAEMMGVPGTPTSASLIASPAAVDLYQFKDGLAGTGPLGFQPGIAAAAPGDEGYSPMWRIYLASWDDPGSASLLETVADVGAMVSAGHLSTEIARPGGADHIVNCPFIDPFQ